MAHISQTYRDDKIIEALHKLHPEIEFGNTGRVADIHVDPVSDTATTVALTVTIDFRLTRWELDAILNSSKDMPVRD